jgi:predicted DNA-binding WGR domain protein
MPRFELDEGTSKKFYSIERVGLTVELRWGRIGAAGQLKTVTAASEAEAQRVYDEEVFRRRERGYLLVVDASKPHDPEAAKRARLEAQTGAPLGAEPRFVFRRKKQVTWLEVRGASLFTANGSEAPVETTLASSAAAVRERDRSMATLLEQGFELEAFDAAAPKTTRRASAAAKALSSNRELEEALAKDPTSEETWKVYEDWLLQVGDPRGKLMEAEHGGTAGDAAEARGRVEKLLFGARAGALQKRIRSAEWRSGHLLSCDFDASGPKGGELFEAFCATAAVRFLMELHLHGDFELFPRLRALPRLRRLAMQAEFQGDYRPDAVALEQMANLESLHLMDISALGYHACLNRLRELTVNPSRALSFDELFSQPFGALEKLTLHLGHFGGDVGAQAIARAAPRLTDLELVVDKARIQEALEEIVASPLPARLARFRFLAYEKCRVLEPGEKQRLFNGAFAAIAHVELPESLFGR